MFKLGVVGHPDTLQAVAALVDEYLDGVEVLPEPFGTDAGMPDVVGRIAELQTRCHGILYSRKDPYLLVSGQLDHTVPARYVDIDSSHLLISLLAATVQYGAVPGDISLDSFDAPAAGAALAGVGIGPERVRLRLVSVPQDGREGLVDATLRQHLANHAAGAGLCVTNITAVHQSLLAVGVPATLISPTPESFVHEIRNLMLRHQLAAQGQGGLAALHVRLSHKGKYRYYGATPLRELDDLSRAAKLIAVFAEELDSAMFQLGRWEYVIVCRRSLLETVTDHYAEIGLLRSITLETAFDAAIGIGCGGTVREADANALSALNEVLDLGGTHAMVVTGAGAALGPIQEGSRRRAHESATEANLAGVAARTGLSLQALNRLHELTLARNTSLVTSQQLAEQLGVSTRTVNRMLARLLAGGYAAVEGKDLGQTHGRPARVIRLRF